MYRLRSQGCKLDIPQGCLKGELHGCDSSTILNSCSWSAQRAYAMEGIRNPEKNSFPRRREADWGCNGSQVMVSPHPSERFVINCRTSC